MHERFVAGEKKRTLERNVLVQATQERVKAEQLLEEANRKLFTAERTLEDAQLLGEGWIKDQDWIYNAAWQHPSGFDITRFIGEGDNVQCQWVVRRLSTPIAVQPYVSTITARPYTHARVTLRGAAQPNNPTPTVLYHQTLEAALEWWRLQIINLGRYPEPPPKGLFDRLRDASV